MVLWDISLPSYPPAAFLNKGTIPCPNATNTHNPQECWFILQCKKHGDYNNDDDRMLTASPSWFCFRKWKADQLSQRLEVNKQGEEKSPQKKKKKGKGYIFTIKKTNNQLIWSKYISYSRVLINRYMPSTYYMSRNVVNKHYLSPEGIYIA